jgi:hypothetical protein
MPRHKLQARAHPPLPNTVPGSAHERPQSMPVITPKKGSSSSGDVYEVLVRVLGSAAGVGWGGGGEHGLESVVRLIPLCQCCMGVLVLRSVQDQLAPSFTSLPC